ncbi:MAG: hypothetical protein IT538_02915 [Variibacter sp.]|nr:hypothetical protein [Variibacter sp.]
MQPNIRIEISPGELIDRLTILEIKLDHIADPAKRANILQEYEVARQALADGVPPSAEIATLRAELKATNQSLWRVEDDLREHERRGEFDQRFIALARSVYRTNDRRAALKRAINDLLGSKLVEEKSYSAY